MLGADWKRLVLAREMKQALVDWKDTKNFRGSESERQEGRKNRESTLRYWAESLNRGPGELRLIGSTEPNGTWTIANEDRMVIRDLKKQAEGREVVISDKRMKKFLKR